MEQGVVGMLHQLAQRLYQDYRLVHCGRGEFGQVAELRFAFAEAQGGKARGETAGRSEEVESGLQISESAEADSEVQQLHPEQLSPVSDLFPNLDQFLLQRQSNTAVYRYHPKMKQDLLAWIQRHLNNGHSLASLCSYLQKQINIPARSIRRWMRIHNHPRRLTHKEQLPLMEARLKEYLRYHRDLENAEIIDEARRLTEEIYGREVAEGFGFSRGWLEKFRKRMRRRQDRPA